MTCQGSQRFTLLYLRRRSPPGALAPPRAGTAVIAAAVASIVAFPSAGSIFKCAMESGGFMYQEAPCPPGKELRNFDTDPPTLSVIPGASTPAPTLSPPPADRPTASPDKSAKRMVSGHDDRANGRVDGDVSARKFVRAGMSDVEVRAKLGQPDITSGSSKSRNARWSYLPVAGDPDTITTITFSGNVVSDVSRKLVKR